MSGKTATVGGSVESELFEAALGIKEPCCVSEVALDTAAQTLTSPTKRKRVEECFGWLKTIGGLRKSPFVGSEKPDFQFVLTFAAYNLVRMHNLRVVPCQCVHIPGIGASGAP